MLRNWRVLGKLLSSCFRSSSQTVVELWPKDEVEQRLTSLQEQQPCVLRKGQVHYSKDGARRMLYFCHRGPKNAGADTYIHLYRSPLVSVRDSCITAGVFFLASPPDCLALFIHVFLLVYNLHQKWYTLPTRISGHHDG